MSTGTFQFARGAANIANQVGEMYLYTPIGWRISNCKVSCECTLTQAQIEAGMTAEMTLELTSGGNTVSQTVEVSGDRQDYSFSIGINVAAFDNVRIRTITTNCRTFYNVISQHCAGGWVGSGIIPATIGFNDMTIDIAYTPDLTVDSDNDGYPHSPEYDVTKFVFFDKDENGYPKNWGVWKQDGQNDGYPWPIGFEKYTPTGFSLYKKTETGLVKVNVYKKTDTGLVPVTIYYKTANGLVPVG